jgi:hypothetical protein
MEAVMSSSNAERVPANTAAEINERIHRETVAAVERAAEGGPASIDARLDALDKEWDIERAIEANASTLMLVGLTLGIFAKRSILLLPVAVGGFLLQHALQGWCPPVPILRRLGFRTQAEIERERTALKALRGDFDGLQAEGIEPAARAASALRAAHR